MILVIALLFGIFSRMQRKPHGLNVMPCPYCREPMPRKATVCPHCGRESHFTFRWQRQNPKKQQPEEAE
jgi:predicted amidophosphoribosyltransferase